MINYQTRWRSLWNPNMYHGWNQKTNYFEGWYFKVVNADESAAFAFIPGIFLGENEQAFIQVLDGKNCQAEFHSFPITQFQPSPQKFELNLASNFFSEERLSLDLADIKGEIQLLNTTPWPKMLGAPGVMGWFSFVPFMECYHGVVSMYHQLKGSLEIKGKPIDFTNGYGYIEKDWGRSFPKAWIWMQSNHFNHPEEKKISFFCSAAIIPWLGSHFIGYLSGLQVGDKLYRFATYTGAKMKAALAEETVSISFKDRTHRLEIIAHKGPTGKLAFPLPGTMTGKVNESLQASIELQLFEKEKPILTITGRNAGLEVAGPVEKILTNQWRR